MRRHLAPLGLATSIVLVLSLAVTTAVSLRAAAEPDPRLAEAPLTGPTDYLDAQRAIGVDLDAYGRALDQARAISELTAEVAPDLAALEWEHLGPTNIGGRIVDLAIDPDELNTVYIAAATGGVWKSTDAGLRFSRAWPDDVTQSMGAIAIGSDGTLYAGTGESNPGGGSMTYGGTGLYRSRDRGDTWELAGLPTSGAFGRIVVDPTNPQRVFAAAVGNIFVPGGERGLYRSTDGGDSWERVLEGDNARTGAVDVAMDPSDPDHLLAALWDRQRFPTHREYSGAGSGLYRSTDGGDTWDRVDAITMPDPVDNGRIGVAFAPGDASRVYAMIFNIRNGTFGRLFRSDNGGASWTTVSPGSMLTGNVSSFGWWFGGIWVDPASADRLFIAGVELLDSRDGGQTWLPHSNTTAGVLTGVHQVNVHADQHAMAWHPSIPGRVYLGNDGGFYRSDLNGLQGTWTPALVQGWTQHYSVDVSASSPDKVVSGLQDNMCQRNFVAETDLGTEATWTKYGLCGDGLQTLIHPTDETITWGCSQYGGCTRARFGAPDLTSGSAPGRKGWFAPLLYDPHDPNVMYMGSTRVYRSGNGGNAWQAISEDLTGDPEQLDPHSGYRIYGTLTAIAVARSTTGVIMAGTDNGHLWRTQDGGDTWEELTHEVLPEGWITRVAIDPSDADVAYVTYSGYRSGDESPKVVVTRDGGATWENISGNLPQAQVNTIQVVDGTLIVGTDTGAYLSRDGGGLWLRLGTLPTVPVMYLHFHESTRTLTAATFGHGVQRLTLPVE
jgi:photosystem II stability/assembly factor-like uncharacterized protein